jgi:RNA polymerase sigma-70 factor, ECF subfamily
VLNSPAYESIGAAESRKSPSQQPSTFRPVSCESLKPMFPPPAAPLSHSIEEEGLLIGQVLVGRRELFMDLLQPHLVILSRLVRFQMHNDAETDDVVQQTILNAFARLNQFRFEARFRTWLIRIANNEVLQWRRRRAASKIDLLDRDGFIRLKLADRALSPLRQFERIETARLFQRALAKLSPSYREMIRFRDLQGLSILETAQLLRVSINTVKTRHRRARLKMVGILTPIWDGRSLSQKASAQCK